MQHHNRLIIAVIVAVLPLAGCGKAIPAKPAAQAPSKLEKQQDGIARITLTQKAAERLGIKFAEMAGSTERLVAPYNALLYDPAGGEWVYVNPEPNVFRRTDIKVQRIEGDKAYLAKGPSVGTKVVTDGAAELYGIEFGIK